MNWFADWICRRRGHPTDFDVGGSYYGCPCGLIDGPCPSCGSLVIEPYMGIGSGETCLCRNCGFAW